MYKRFEFQLIERFQFLCRYIRLFEYSITYSCIPPYLHIWDGILSNYCISIYMFQLLRILRLEWYIDLPVPCLLCGGKKIANEDFPKNLWKILLKKKWKEGKWIERKKKREIRGIYYLGKKLTGISALETFVKFEGEGNVDLHHFHLRYTRRMCHDSSTPSKH